MGSKRLFTELVLYYNMIKNMIYSVHVCKSDMSGFYSMPLCRMCIILYIIDRQKYFTYFI